MLSRGSGEICLCDRTPKFSRCGLNPFISGAALGLCDARFHPENSLGRHLAGLSGDLFKARQEVVFCWLSKLKIPSEPVIEQAARIALEWMCSS